MMLLSFALHVNRDQLAFRPFHSESHRTLAICRQCRLFDGTWRGVRGRRMDILRDWQIFEAALRKYLSSST
jgi:hypothetical protein